LNCGKTLTDGMRANCQSPTAGRAAVPHLRPCRWSPSQTANLELCWQPC
jgi:hypothetical protein